MQFSNDPDIAIAQEWLGELEGWLERHGLQGYDPFDVKQHRLIRSTQSIAPLRKATTGLCDLYPLAVRRLLRVPQTENPKAHALTALACLRRFELESEPRFLDQASGHLRWLREHACAGASGLCWGYPFDVRGKGVDSPKGTPVGVVVVVGMAVAMSVVVVVVLQADVEGGAQDAGDGPPLGLQAVPVDRQDGQDRLDGGQRRAQVEQGPHQHVAGDAREAFEVERAGHGGPPS